MRGTHVLRWACPTRRRFIPACAGNAWLPTYRTATYAVHPRVCGERRRPGTPAISRCGSSPRVRGTPRSARHRASPTRFIPACAGNAKLSRSIRAFSSVHPRVCGERVDDVDAAGRQLGSSPRVRGTLETEWRRFEQRRFIPACAGNAGRRAGWRAVPAVHPRVCGERKAISIWIFSPGGSSPRVRGTPLSYH